MPDTKKIWLNKAKKERGVAMNRKSLLVALVLVVSTGAWAGKEEREKKAELEPRVKAASDAFKSHCGGSISITVDWKSYKTVNDMYQLGYAMDAITEGAATYCKDSESKNAMRALKSVNYAFGNIDKAPAYKDGKIEANSDSSGRHSWEQFTKLVDQ